MHITLILYSFDFVFTHFHWFNIHLVVAYTKHVHILLFVSETLPSDMDTDSENQSLRQKHEQIFINVHMVLKAISKIVPM